MMRLMNIAYEKLGMSSNIRKGKLRPEDQQAIRCNYTFLLDELDSNSIAQFLFAHDVLDKSEEEEILNLYKGNRETGNHKLLSILLFAGPGDAYNIFLESLKQNQGHVLKILTDSRAKSIPAQQLISRQSEETVGQENSNDIESDCPGNESAGLNTDISEVTIGQPETVSAVQEETASQNLLKELEELRMEKERLNTTTKENEKQTKSLLSALAILNNSQDACETNNNTIMSRSDRQSDEIESLKEQNATLSTQLEELKKEKAGLNSVIEELRNTTTTLKATIEDLKKDHIIKSNAEITDLKTENNNLKFQNDVYRARYSPSFESQVKSQEKELLLLHAERFQMVNDLDACLQKIVQSYNLKPVDGNIQELFHFVSLCNFSKTLISLVSIGMDVDKQIQVKRQIVVVKTWEPYLKTDVVDKLEKKQYALMSAAGNGSFKTLGVLLGNGARVNDKDSHGDTALIYACRGRCLENSSEYVTRGKFEQPFTANDQVVCIDSLLTSSADIDTQGHHGMTALMCCAKNGDFRLLDTLLMHFPNKEVKCLEGKTALMYACSRNSERNARCAKLLVEKSCDFNAKDFKGDTALMHCIEADNYDAFLSVVEAGADVNAQNEQGLTCLMHAASTNHSCYIEELVKRRADVNRQDYTLTTALMIAAISPAPSSGVSLLLRNGADPNIRNCKGETALMLAASHLLVDKVQALLSADVKTDVNLRANNDMSALKMARRSTLGNINDKEKIVSLLLGANAKE